MCTMFAWILILSSWVALLALILHDATKEDSDGGAISIVARNFKALTSWATRQAQKLRKTPGYGTPQETASAPPVEQAPPVKQAPAVPPKRKWWHKDHRASLTTSELELAISEAVRTATPGCEDFVGVIVQHARPKSNRDPNWAIRGVKFGKADRKMVDEALSTVLERMQREFLLSDD